MDNWFKKAFRKQASNWMTINPATGQPIWQTFIDTFWQRFFDYMPELRGSEFDMGEGDDYAAVEGNKFIFEHWLREVPDDLKELGDLKPEFKQQVRQYLMQTQNFDPFEEEGGDDLGPENEPLPPEDDVEAFSPDELEQMFSEEAVEPGAANERHPDIETPSPDDLENMFSEDVYDPGAPEERRRRHQGGEWWQ